MQRHESALKAARQALRHRARNQATLGKCRTSIKALREALATKVSKEEAKKTLIPMLQDVSSTLMKAANKKILKKGTVSRQIARLSVAIQKATA